MEATNANKLDIESAYDNLVEEFGRIGLIASDLSAIKKSDSALNRVHAAIVAIARAKASLNGEQWHERTRLLSKEDGQKYFKLTLDYVEPLTPEEFLTFTDPENGLLKLLRSNVVGLTSTDKDHRVFKSWCQAQLNNLKLTTQEFNRAFTRITSEMERVRLKGQDFNQARALRVASERVHAVLIALAREIAQYSNSEWDEGKKILSASDGIQYLRLVEPHKFARNLSRSERELFFSEEEGFYPFFKRNVGSLFRDRWQTSLRKWIQEQFSSTKASQIEKEKALDTLWQQLDELQLSNVLFEVSNRKKGSTLDTIHSILVAVAKYRAQLNGHEWNEDTLLLKRIDGIKYLDYSLLDSIHHLTEDELITFHDPENGVLELIRERIDGLTSRFYRDHLQSWIKVELDSSGAPRSKVEHAFQKVSLEIDRMEIDHVNFLNRGIQRRADRLHTFLLTLARAKSRLEGSVIEEGKKIISREDGLANFVFLDPIYVRLNEQEQQDFINQDHGILKQFRHEVPNKEMRPDWIFEWAKILFSKIQVQDSRRKEVLQKLKWELDIIKPSIYDYDSSHRSGKAVNRLHSSLLAIARHKATLENREWDDETLLLTREDGKREFGFDY